MDKLTEALEQEVYAVVGASTNKAKYGYKVFKTLSNYDLSVYPVNPTPDKIDGKKCYDRLEDIPEQVDVAVTVVPAKVSKKIMNEAAELDIEFVWMQPGSEFDGAESQGQELGLKVISNDCIMVQMKDKIDNN